VSNPAFIPRRAIRAPVAIIPASIVGSSKKLGISCPNPCAT